MTQLELGKLDPDNLGVSQLDDAILRKQSYGARLGLALLENLNGLLPGGFRSPGLVSPSKFQVWCHLSKRLNGRGLAFSITLTMKLVRDFQARFLTRIHRQAA